MAPYSYGQSYIYSYEYGDGPADEEHEMPVSRTSLFDPEGEHGVAGHGTSAYRRGCKCEVCRAAKAQSARTYRQKRQAQRRGE